MSKTVKFFTLGCKVNQYDTQSIRERFIKEGFQELYNGDKADIYIINTCTVTASADRKSRAIIRRCLKENPKAKIIVTGCYTELDSDEIAKISGVTHIIKNQDKDRIVELLKGLNPVRNTETIRERNKISNGLNPVRNTETIRERNKISNGVNGQNDIGISNFSAHTRAFLKIQDGCDNFCSYCKVPLVRGRSSSRSLNEVSQEAERLVKTGFKEIVLCGICLGAYGRDLVLKLNLVDVIEALEKIAGLLRIRLSSVEAGDVSDELINKMAQSKKLCRHLHIPIQSGDDEILKKMNRRYTRGDYSGLISKIKRSIPEIAITTDCLVGFPGEEEANFHNTVDLIKETLPLKVHIFPYSKRKATPAASNFKEEVDTLIIKQRILQIKDVAGDCSFVYRKQFLNKVMDALIEGQSKEKPGLYEGRTDNYIKILIKSSPNLKNQIIPVRLKKILEDSVLADFVGRL